MRTAHTIALEMYNCKLTVVIADNIEAESKRIYKKFKVKQEEDEDGESEGMVFSIDLDKYFLLIETKYLTHNTIAHEIYHAAVRITEERGITDEEAQAWLTGHITGSIYKFLYKKKFKVKHG
jgi:hypothetical protein